MSSDDASQTATATSGDVAHLLEIASSVASKFVADVPDEGNLKWLYARAIVGAVGHVSAMLSMGVKGEKAARYEVLAMAARGDTLLSAVISAETKSGDTPSDGPPTSPGDDRG